MYSIIILFVCLRIYGIVNNTEGVPRTEGVAKGSTEYWKAKYERQVAITQRLFNTEVGPKEAGILEVTVQQKRPEFEVHHR